MSDRRCSPIAVSKARAAAGWNRLDMLADVARHHAEPADVRDGVETREDACARAYADGYAAAALEHAEEVSRLRALVATATALRPEPSAELAALIVRAVAGLARVAIGTAPVDPEWLQRCAEDAAAIISQCDGAQSIWLHPDDVALLDGAQIGMAVNADPAAEPGSIRITCSAGWIEHGRPLYLERLDAMLAAQGLAS